MFIVKYKNIFFIFSALLVLASLASLLIFGLKPGIDFTGGTVAEISYTTLPPKDALTSALAPLGLGDASVRQEGDKGYIVRTRPTTADEQSAMTAALKGAGEGSTLERVANIGPTIGAELARKSFLSVGLVILMIVLYIAFAFRKVSKPVSSFIYGLAAVVGLIHNVLIPIGVFALLGHYFGTEVDTLFVAALLTVLGFSVHDTIVVFDRIRENLRVNASKNLKEDFELTVGKSLQQTYVRSINTSLTVIIVLLALFFIGGSTTEDFTLALLIGIIFGTYSSICLASPLLIVWQKLSARPDRSDGRGTRPEVVKKKK